MRKHAWHPANLLHFIVRPLDPILLMVLLCLMGYAVFLMGSASPERVSAQLLNSLVGLSVMWVAARVSYRRLLSIALPLYCVGVLLLIAVALFGASAKGAQRWLDFGFIRIQPSELMKIAMPLMLAWFFQQREGRTTWKEYVVAAVLLLIPFLLIAKQPDLGTAILVFAAGTYILFFAGLSWRLILPIAVVGTIGLVSVLMYGEQWCRPDVAWMGLRDYQKHRICTLLDPTSDPLGKGFHIIQSTIAIGSGGVSGKGWGAGTQTHLSFIPERHTDFIFAVLGEELGLLGAVILLLLYVALIVRGFVIALYCPMLGGRLLAGSISMIFFTYVFVNMGMVTGMLPVVGVPMPFMSYGGTAMVTLSLGVGILMCLARTHRDRHRYAPPIML